MFPEIPIIIYASYIRVSSTLLMKRKTCRDLWHSSALMCFLLSLDIQHCLLSPWSSPTMSSARYQKCALIFYTWAVLLSFLFTVKLWIQPYISIIWMSTKGPQSAFFCPGGCACMWDGGCVRGWHQTCHWYVPRTVPLLYACPSDFISLYDPRFEVNKPWL